MATITDFGTQAMLSCHVKMSEGYQKMTGYDSR